MFDTLLVAERMQGQTFAQAWVWYIHYHSSWRPLRVIEWWLAAQAFGAEVWRYEAVNAVAMAAAMVATMRIAERLGFSSRRAWVIGLALGVSYAAAYGFLHFPFALNLALGLWGLDAGLRGRWWGLALIALASLGHETNLLLAVVVVLFTYYERPILSRAFWWANGLALAGGLSIVAYLWRRGIGYEMPAFEHIGRVLVPAMTGGLAVESYRFIGEPYARARDFLLTHDALVYVVAAVPTIAAWCTVRSRLLWGWVGIGVVALLLPVGTPESYHLLVVFPALFMLWARLSWRWAPVLVVVAILHLVARVNLAGDVAAMKTQIFARGGWADRAADMTPGYSRELLGVPLLIGAHWAYLPAISAHGSCILEPVWFWRRAWTPIDSPEYAEAVRRGRTLLAHPTMGRVDDGRLTVCR